MRRLATHAEDAIVVPTHNGVALTLRLVDSLRALEGPDVMVVIVDDGATDGTVEALAEHHPDVLIVRGGGLWWSGAANLGCRFSIGRGARRLLVLTNDDVAAPNLVVELRRVLDEVGGCVSAVHVDRPSPEGSPIESYGVLDFAGRGVGVRRPTEEEAGGLLHCEWLLGSCLMFSAETFMELGGFDERRFPHYRGDIDFGLRLRDRGYPRVVTGGTWVYNDPAQTWISFKRPVPVMEFVRGFWNYKSDYNIRETLRFAFEYCPPRLLPWYLFQFYARWTYAFLKTYWRAARRAVRGLTSRS